MPRPTLNRSPFAKKSAWAGVGLLRRAAVIVLLSGAALHGTGDDVFRMSAIALVVALAPADGRSGRKRPGLLRAEARSEPTSPRVAVASSFKTASAARLAARCAVYSTPTSAANDPLFCVSSAPMNSGQRALVRGTVTSKGHALSVVEQGKG